MLNAIDFWLAFHCIFLFFFCRVQLENDVSVISFYFSHNNFFFSKYSNILLMMMRTFSMAYGRILYRNFGSNKMNFIWFLILLVIFFLLERKLLESLETVVQWILRVWPKKNRSWKAFKMLNQKMSTSAIYYLGDALRIPTLRTLI